jgi:hypothetical protein
MQVRMQAKPLFSLLVATLLLASCRKPEPVPTPTPSTVQQPVTDSCAVLTPSEISAALGIPIDPGKHTLPSSSIMCDWSQTGLTGDKAVKLVLNFSSVAAFNREKGATGDVHVTPAPGIGDEAVYVTSEFGTSLLLRKGDTSIGFSFHNLRLPAAQTMAKERALGLAAAARM